MTPPARKRSATAIFRAVRPSSGTPEPASAALGIPRQPDSIAAGAPVLSRWTVWLVSALLVAVLGFLAARWATNDGVNAEQRPTLRLGVDGVLSVDDEKSAENTEPAE